MIEKSKNLIDLVAGIIGIAFDRVQAGHNGDLANEPNAAPADDLTQINGIGPAFASRLNEAGITTFADLANQSPEEVREAARIAGGQADPEEWIAEAGTLA
jgi:large subunit ribosomal protein L21